MESDGCDSFIQLQRKWLQHLNDLYLSTKNLLQKIKQEHLYLHVFVVGSPICLLGLGYCLKCLETLFLINLFENVDR